MFWFKKRRQMEQRIAALEALAEGAQIQINALNQELHTTRAHLDALDVRVDDFKEEVDSADQKVIESKVDEYLDGVDLSDAVSDAVESLDLSGQIQSSMEQMDLTEEVEKNLKDFDITSMVSECLEEMDFSEYITEEMMAEAFKTALQGIKETK